MKPARIQWIPSYELGVEDIDFQHHFFLNLINRIAEEFSWSEDPGYRAALVTELNAYARFHFISEENMMRRAGYVGLKAHKRLHTALIEELSILQNALVLKNSNKTDKDVIDFLVNWFLHHTTGEDRLFAHFLQNKNRSPP